MDLFLIAGKIWRYRLFTLPVMILTIAGAAYVVAVKKPMYQAAASYLLINPPSPPSDVEIAENPALAKVKADNPYTRFGDQSVIIDVLVRTIGTPKNRVALMRAGADPRYAVSSGAQGFGSNSPIVQVVGIGSSPQAAMKTAEVVSHGVLGELDRIQADQKVDREYRIKAIQVEAPQGAQLRASGQLRTLVGVVVFGAIVLFVVVSLADGVQALRRERAAQARAQEFPVLEHHPAGHSNGHDAEAHSNGHVPPPAVPAGKPTGGSWFSD